MNQDMQSTFQPLLSHCIFSKISRFAESIWNVLKLAVALFTYISIFVVNLDS